MATESQGGVRRCVTTDPCNLHPQGRLSLIEISFILVGSQNIVASNGLTNDDFDVIGY